jgi:hypothetical protein
MADPRRQIDSYLGDGWYDDWQKMDKEADLQEKRYDQNRAHLKLPFTSPLFDRIEGDLRVLYKIQADYRQAMNLIISGRKVDTKKIDQLYDLYSLAIGVADTENDVHEALFLTGFAAAWVMIPFMLLQAEANALAQTIEELEKALKEAESEATKAKVKAGIHGVITVLEFIFPEVSLVARAGIFLGEVAVDKALGPKDQSTAQKYTGIGTPGVKQFSEAVHDIDEYSDTARSVAGKTGKIATAATFYFDYEEITEGSERVEKLETLTRNAKSAYDSLVKTLRDNKPKLDQFLIAFDRWVRAVEDIRLTAGNIREALSADITKFGYSRTQPMVWAATR